MDVAREKDIEKGRQEDKCEFVKSLLLNMDFDIEKISILAGVSHATVIKIHKEIKQYLSILSILDHP